jgi:Xaa-Pro aminopeptidase
MTEQWSAEWSGAVFSVAERDQRWSGVRRLMARDGMDVIVCLPCSNSHNRGAADALYLTQLGDNAEETAVYFPIDGDVTAWLSVGGVWPTSNWMTDIRSLRLGAGGAAIAERLQEAGFRRGTIGIAGLTGGVLGHCREEEGEANWESVELIKNAFPNARVTSATELLGEARFQKSDEEIGFLRKGTQIAERVVTAVARSARVGVRERQVFAEMMFTSAIEGASFTPMVGWISGPRGHVYHRLEQPSFRSFQPDDILVLEVDGRYGGYIAQLDQTFAFGRLNEDTKAAMQLTLESFDRVVERLKPGVTVKELIDTARVEGMGGRGVATLGMHGRGTGDDGPLVIPNTAPEVLGTVMKENAVMVVKPGTSVDGQSYAATWSDVVLVTRDGGRRLGTRPREVLELI